ncbi:uncharacterized protein F13E9.13, mitochondrial-like [Tubulanus polymorphus]|uniref:uncharacterized protein F13E9.13, mitochondrial-like n=1 Tax=Tubulanus polymorphus TaxID=672921 RepID=UPI003DA6067D
MALNRFKTLFGRTLFNVIGMVHVDALPGTPKCTHKMDAIIERALKDVEIYKSANVDSILIENMHDIPYQHTSQVGPEIVASMTAVCCKIRDQCPNIPLGIQILAGANHQALAVALAAGLDYIRAEGFVFAHVADEGLMNSCAAEVLRYRRQIGAEHIHVFTDVKKKHSSHAITSDVSITETVKAAEFFLSDGVILTGTSTGAVTDVNEFTDARNECNLPVLIGSGVTSDNIELYSKAHGLIVGSHFKENGNWLNPVDSVRVNKFMDKVRKLRSSNTTEIS